MFAGGVETLDITTSNSRLMEFHLWYKQNNLKRASGKQLRNLRYSQACILARTVPLFTDDVIHAVTESCVEQSTFPRSSVALSACPAPFYTDLAPVSETIYFFQWIALEEK